MFGIVAGFTLLTGFDFSLQILKQLQKLSWPLCHSEQNVETDPESSLEHANVDGYVNVN